MFHNLKVRSAFNLSNTIIKSIRCMKMTSDAKKIREQKTIGTHNGTFHCDEVTACFLLKQLPEYKDAEIVRSRDPDLLAKCDVVVDVGGVYDPSINRLDHHQRDFQHTFHSLQPEKPWKIKLSSAGLTYLHFGERILSEMTGVSESSPLLKKFYDKVYEHLILEIDAIDNGVSVADGDLRYSINSGLSSRVGNLNPWWNQPDVDENSRFEDAMRLVGVELTDYLHYLQHAWWPARQLVEKAFSKRHAVDPSGDIMVLGEESTGCPWKAHLLDLEKETQSTGVLFVLYPDNNGTWRVQTVPVDEQRKFDSRLNLPETWRGLRDEALSKVANIPGCVFVHASGFIGGNRSYEGALEMAKTALRLDKLAGTPTVTTTV